MTDDLFSCSQQFQRLPMQDAEVLLLNRCKLPEPEDALLEALIAQTPWRAEEITVYGKRYLQPRLAAWYGDAGSAYRYSGLLMQPLPWTALLASVRDAVQTQCGETFNSVLLNYYRNGQDSMGMHSDDEPELGPQPVIASLSLGQTRTLVFKHKRLKELASVRLPLESGALLLMKGTTQRNWKHGISKSAKPLGPRLNLTFRQVRASHCR